MSNRVHLKLLAGWVTMILLGSMPLQTMAQRIYVSPQGDDSQSGTLGAPMQTLHAAQKLARKWAGKTRVTVTLLDGVYCLAEPLVITGEDSGSAQAPLVYKAQNEGKAVISGGVPLSLKWEPYKDGVFKAQGPRGAAFDRLFVDGALLMMARYPNYDPSNKFVPYRGASADAISPERSSRWADPAGGYIHAMHPSLWGGFSYRIKGKDDKGALIYEGGWQNNRPASMHEKFRMVEGIFEELDAPGEWHQDQKTGIIYIMPPAGCRLDKAEVVGVRLASLIELRGTAKSPVHHVGFEGITFRHTARTFMQNREPLLRSDWTIHRGGAVLFEGTDQCSLKNSFIDQPGGNGVFVNSQNRRLKLSGLHIFGSGASGVAFVGLPSAVRNPAFNYYAPHKLSQVDLTPGPKTQEFPMECVLEDSLIHEVGLVDKQAAGVQISMSRRITVRNCSIYDTSRSGININEGTWGGHLIEGCDVFRTVQETGDHGSFNSWGRDRFWVPNTDETAAEVEKNPSLPFLDAVEPVVIKNSRWRCDHGWDIDLDDGSTNYIIKNNLLLNGGLKLREGYKRIVTNNIIVNNSLHPHVWYPQSGDVFAGNVVMAAYQPAVMRQGKWGSLIDKNLFASSEDDRAKFAAHGADPNSLLGDPQFSNPAAGDFAVTNSALARAIGFKNFPMDRFGVRRPSLRAIADTPVIPAVVVKASGAAQGRSKGVVLGVTFFAPQGQELSAYGASFDAKGLAVEQIEDSSPLGGSGGLRKGDFLLSVNGTGIGRIEDLQSCLDKARDGKLAVRLLRAQKEEVIHLVVKRG